MGSPASADRWKSATTLTVSRLDCDVSAIGTAAAPNCVASIAGLDDDTPAVGTAASSSHTSAISNFDDNISTIGASHDAGFIPVDAQKLFANGRHVRLVEHRGYPFDMKQVHLNRGRHGCQFRAFCQTQFLVCHKRNPNNSVLRNPAKITEEFLFYRSELLLPSREINGHNPRLAVSHACRILAPILPAKRMARIQTFVPAFQKRFEPRDVRKQLGHWSTLEGGAMFRPIESS